MGNNRTLNDFICVLMKPVGSIISTVVVSALGTHLLPNKRCTN